MIDVANVTVQMRLSLNNILRLSKRITLISWSKGGKLQPLGHEWPASRVGVACKKFLKFKDTSVPHPSQDEKIN